MQTVPSRRYEWFYAVALFQSGHHADAMQQFDAATRRWKA